MPGMYPTGMPGNPTGYLDKLKGGSYIPNWGGSVGTALGTTLPYLPGVMNIIGDAPEKGIGQTVGTALGSPFGPIGMMAGGFLGGIAGSMFQNQDPDQYLWGDAVKRLTGNNPDGWGSGGDWSQWLQQKYGLDKGTGDHYGGMIRRKEMNPDQAIAAITGANRSSGGGESGGGGSGGMSMPQGMSTQQFANSIPNFQMPDSFTNTQKDLYSIGTSMLGWKPDEALAAVGESGGAEFQKMLSSVTANTMKALAENQAARGVKGGLGGVQTAGTIGDISAQLGYQDYGRAMQGRQFLGEMERSYRGMGADVIGGVRSAEQGVGLAANQYGMNKAGMVGDYQLGQQNVGLNMERLKQSQQQINQAYEMGMLSLEQRDRAMEMQQQQWQQSYDQQQSANDDSFWSSLISGGIGLVGGIAGLGQQAQFNNMLADRWDVPVSQSYGSSFSQGLKQLNPFSW